MAGHGARQADMVTPRPHAATAPRRIVVGVSGATGIVYAARLLEVLRQAGTETHLVVTPAAGMTRACETAMEGPMGEYAGYVAPPPGTLKPVLEVTAVTYRNQPILPVAGCWMVLESANSWLVVTVRGDWHERLGIGSRDLAQRVGDIVFPSCTARMLDCWLTCVVAGRLDAVLRREVRSGAVRADGPSLVRRAGHLVRGPWW
jgi:3-octaprenyl-4-hydroxybenzoate carboxy-lyase/Flavoprotein